MFQPPKASHASGVWERLIRSSRTALKATQGERLVEEDVLATVLTEVEATLNSRPLCAISDDPNDLQPLTPNYLLLQRTVSALPPGTFVKEDIPLRKKWRQTQVLACLTIWGAMVERVCSSSTGETKMAQTSTKRASGRPSTSSGSRSSQRKVAFGPYTYCQGDSRKRWARANN